MPCLLDIGWNDLFVPSVNCTSSDCYGRPKYVASASSSHSSNKTSVSIFYWVEQTWGLRTLDSLHLGELTIPNYVFEEASEVEGWLWPEDSAPIGVLGLARLPYHIRWSNLSSHNSFQRMLTDDLLGCAIFSLKLPQSHSDIGELLFGAVNDTYFRGRVSILDVTGHLIDPRLEWFSGGWQVQGHSARFGRHVFEDLSNKTAIFTSVFPEVGMPGRMLHHVEAALHPDTLGDVHCSKRLILPDFIITLGTGSRISSFVLSPWDYIRSSSKAIKGCSTIFVPSDEEKEEDYFLIGNLFLDRYYHIFDAENMTVASKICKHP